MLWVETKEKYAVVWVDIFDSTAIAEGKVDSVTKDLMVAIKEKLEEKEAERRK